MTIGIPLESSFHLGAPAQSPNQITVDVLTTTEHPGLNVAELTRWPCARYYYSTYLTKYCSKLQLPLRSQETQYG